MLVLYGIRIVGFHALKGPIIGANENAGYISLDPGVVPGDVVPPEVVRQDEDDIGRLSVSSSQLGETAENEEETPHRSQSERGLSTIST